MMALPENYLMNLPEEISTEIFAKLPEKSLVTLTCVSKTLQDLITTNSTLVEKITTLKYTKILKERHSNVIFLTRSLITRGANEDSILTHDYDDPLSLDFHPLRDFESNADVEVLGWCNGILLCSKYDRADLSDDRPGTLFFHNPITGDVLQIPPVLSRDDEDVEVVGFNSNDCVAFFGFDPSSNDYKLILIRHALYEENDERFVDIYRASTNCWSNLDVDFDFEDYHWQYVGGRVNLKGNFNGIEKQLFPNSVNFDPKERILTFDFSSERFGVIEYPIESEEWHGMCLNALDDSLALCVNQLGESSDIHIWVMTEYGKEESWTKKFCVELLGGLSSKVLAFWVHDMNLVVLSHADDGKNSDRTKRRSTFVQEDGKYRKLDEHCSFSFGGFAFQPSLISLCSPSSMIRSSSGFSH